MIPEFCIRAWFIQAPWSRNELVEQDMLICRALITIYTDPFLAETLAFRGGTALHKLYLSPQPRYSEDIDLVQMAAAPIKKTIDHLRNALAFLGEPKTFRSAHNNTLVFQVSSEIQPRMPMRIKIEINCIEHFAHLGWTHTPFRMNSPWFEGSCQITTYSLDELLGTKLRALYQRRKGRDLFDIFYALTNAATQPKSIVECFQRYMNESHVTPPTRREFESNLLAKISNPDFIGDTTGILRPDISYSPHEAHSIIIEHFISHL